MSASPTESLRALVGGLGVAGLGLAAWPYTVDDAFITARYARRIASGAGYGFQDGSPTDGVTGPAWVLPGILADWVGVDPLVAQKAIGLLFACIAVTWIGAQLGRGVGARVRSGTYALLVVPQATLSIWSVAGLETGLATWAMTACAIGAWRRTAWLGVGAFVIAWTRPELLVAASVLVVWRGGRRDWTLALLGVLGVVAFRLALFGHVLPLSFWAKGGTVAQGLRYVLSGTVVISGIAGVVLVAFARSEPRARVWAVAVGAHVVVVALLGGDWMPGYRLLAPVIPIFGALAALGALRVGLRRRSLAVALVAMASMLPALDWIAQIQPARASADNRDAASPLAEALADHDVALVDIGFLRYRARGDTVDLAGLTDPFIARLPGGHVDKEIPLAYLAERAPDVLLLHARAEPEVDAEGRLVRLAGHPVERRLAASELVRARYRVTEVIRYAESYWYVRLEPR